MQRAKAIRLPLPLLSRLLNLGHPHFSCHDTAVLKVINRAVRGVMTVEHGTFLSRSSDHVTHGDDIFFSIDYHVMIYLLLIHKELEVTATRASFHEYFFFVFLS